MCPLPFANKFVSHSLVGLGLISLQEAHFLYMREMLKTYVSSWHLPVYYYLCQQRSVVDPYWWVGYMLWSKMVLNVSLFEI
jgi:hypothetical protein